MYGRFDQPLASGQTAGEAAFGGDEGSGFNPKKIWGVFLRRWMIVAGAVAIALAWSGIWLVRVTPVYTAAAEVLFDPRKMNVAPGADLVNEIGYNTMVGIATEMKLVRSHSVALRTVRQLGLADDPVFAGAAPSKGIMSSVSSFFGSLFSADTEAERATVDQARNMTEGRVAAAQVGAATPTERIAIDRVRNGVGVQRIGRTLFVRILFNHPNPTLAAMVANGVAEAYLVEHLEARFQGTKRAADWLSERVVTVRRQLEASERAVAEHRARNQLVGTVTGTLSDQRAAAINTQLVGARTETVQKKATFDQARKVLKSGKIATVAVVLQSPTIAALRQQELEIRRREADLLTRYGGEHPKIVKVRAERRDLRRQIRQELAQVVQSLKTDYDFALKKEESLETSLGQLSGAGGRSSGAIIRLRELQREAEANNVLYQTLLSRFKEAEQQSSLPTGRSRVTTPALAPGTPSYPNNRRTIILGLIGGLALGFAGAFLLEYIESGFTTVEQAEKALRLPVLAVVPQLSDSQRTLDGKLLAIPDYVAQKPLSGFGESIRSARVSLQMSDIDRPPKLLMVTSSVPSEGKTTLAMALAYSAAASDKKVLLIDCDLRHPSLSNQFGLGDQPGLTDLLTGNASAENVFVKGSLPGLTIVPSGSTTRHPPDVLGSDRLREFLKIVRDSQDLVLIDAPPVTPVIDSALLSRIVEKVLFVVKWRTTPRDVVARAVGAIDGRNDKIAGIVLNNAQTKKMASYSSYYGYNHKSYQNYYVE